MIILIECAAVCLASIGCWLASKRHRQAGWHVACLGAVTVAVLVMLWDNGGLLFRPSEWSANKRSLESLLFSFVFLIVISVIPALLVVRHHRERFRRSAKDVQHFTGANSRRRSD